MLMVGKKTSRPSSDCCYVFFQTNVIGMFNVCKQAASLMNQNPDGLTNDNFRGVIINTSSVAAFDGQIGK